MQRKLIQETQIKKVASWETNEHFRGRNNMVVIKNYPLALETKNH